MGLSIEFVAFSSYAEGLYTLLRRDNLFFISSMAIADGVEDPATLQSYLWKHQLATNKYALDRSIDGIRLDDNAQWRLSTRLDPGWKESSAQRRGRGELPRDQTVQGV